MFNLGATVFYPESRTSCRTVPFTPCTIYTDFDHVQNWNENVTFIHLNTTKWEKYKQNM